MRPDCIPATIHRTINAIVLHCSATPSGQWLGGKRPGQLGYRTAPSIIDEWHKARGFKRTEAMRNAFNWALPSIGYHWVIDIDGRIWTGRNPEEPGAHVAGHNALTLGICLVGGVEREARYTPAQWASAAELVQGLRTLLGTRTAVVGHRDYSPDTDRDGVVEPHEWLKTCPGFDVRAWVAAGLQPAAAHVVVPA